MINSYKNFIYSINKIKTFLEPQYKKKIKKQEILICISSLIQTLSVASIVPFIAIFFNTEFLYNLKIFNFSIYIQNYDLKIIQLIITVFYCLILILAFLIDYLTISKSIQLSHELQNIIKENVFKTRIFQSYINQVNNSSTKIISVISQKGVILYGLLRSYFSFLNSLFIVIFISIFIALQNFLIFILIFLILIIIFYLIHRKNYQKIKKSSSDLNIHQDKSLKILQNSLGHLTEIKLYSLEDQFINLFKKTNNRIANSLILNQKNAEMPRVKIEYILVFLIVLNLYIINLFIELKNFIPIIAFSVFAFQKMFPSLNKIYYSIASFEGDQSIISDIVKNLSILNNKKSFDKVNYKKIYFHNKIELKNIIFDFNKNKKVINNLNLSIKKNSKVAIIGKTGIGKSTLINIISGMLIPDNGKILVDNVELNIRNIKDWQNKVSIVSQNSFLQDESILKNIVLGSNTKKIDLKKLKSVIKISKIDTFSKNLSSLSKYRVGENGVKVSGGQKQRIAIARALYRNSDILIMDEATNQLDKNTQKYVLDKIMKIKNLTLIFITHDKSILKKFNYIIDLDK